MGIATFPLASGGGFKNYAQKFKSSSTWTAPAGVTLVDAVIVGGGGGGGGGLHNAATSQENVGGGGGGGLVTREKITVVPGTTYNVEVGAGGAGFTGTSITSFTPAQYGGRSSFGHTYTLENAIINGEAQFSSNYWNGGNSGTTPTITNPPAYPAYTTGDVRNQIPNLGSSSVLPTISGVSIGTNTKYFTSNSVMSLNVYGDILQWVSVNPNTQYTASGYFMSGTAGSIGVGVTMTWYTSYNGTAISNSSSGSVTVTGQTAWTRVTSTATAPANATWALVRYQGKSTVNGSNFFVTGMQFQTGASATAYKGLLTSGVDYLSGVGFIATLTGAVAGGGGGGGSLVQSIVSVATPGFGGGWWIQNAIDNYNTMGGNGSGAGGPATNHTVFRRQPDTTNVIDAGVTSVNFFYSLAYTPSKYGNGTLGMRCAGIGASITPGNAGNATFDGYGGGGTGGYVLYSSAGVPNAGYGGGQGLIQTENPSSVWYGVNAVPNTGGGGAGSLAKATGSAVVIGFGGNGGSGVVTLSWMGA